MRITIEEDYRRLQCSECAVTYYFPEKWCTNAHHEKKGWKCPNGHGQIFTGDTEAEKLRRERDRLKQDQSRLEDERRAADERARKAEAATKRLKKRASAGTCPCCSRTFANMAEHMKRQHPEQLTSNGTKVVALKRPIATH